MVKGLFTLSVSAMMLAMLVASPFWSSSIAFNQSGIGIDQFSNANAP